MNLPNQINEYFTNYPEVAAVYLLKSKSQTEIYLVKQPKELTVEDRASTGVYPVKFCTAEAL